MSEKFDLNATSPDERETTIIITGNDATIYSSDFRMINKLDKLFSAAKEDKYGKTYRVHTNNIGFKKDREKRTLTIKQRQDAAERLKAAREKKNKEEHNDD